MDLKKYPPSPYGKPFDKTTVAYKAFTAKQTFTPEEFALLLAGLDPASFDGSIASNSVMWEKAGWALRLIQEGIKDVKDTEDYDDVPF